MKTVTTCPSCGRSGPANAQFCGGCGSRLARVEYASFWRRFGGFLIDALIVGAASILVFIVLAFISSVIIPTPDTEQFDAVSAESFIGLVILMVSMFVPGYGYSVLLNARGGTLGKRWLGMRVERADTGENIGIGRAFGRILVAHYTWSFGFLGYFWCIWDAKNQTWHDKAVGSIVVRT